MQTKKQKVLKLYGMGKSFEYIERRLNIPLKEIREIIFSFKEDNRYKRTFTNEFKRLIAERDLHDYPRGRIAKELGISIATVKSFCEQFGRSKKESEPDFHTVHTEINNIYTLDNCPSCGSTKINNVETEIGQEGIYCLNCGEEHIKFNDKVYRVNWEYIN